jgi:hypothetical protein
MGKPVREWYLGYLAVVAFALLLPAQANAQSTADRLCDSSHANCLFDHRSAEDAVDPSPVVSRSNVATMYLRTRHGGPLAHH